MQRRLYLLAAAVLALLVTLPAAAQGQDFYFTDETGNLDRAAVQNAAADLINEGATVAVYFVNQGGEGDFEQRLRSDGLLSSDGRLRRGLVAVYVSTEPRTAVMRFEDQWNEALAVNENYQSILQTDLAPNLAAGDFTQGFVGTLQAVDESIANPPVPGGGTFVNTLPLAVGGFAIFALLAGGFFVTRRRAAAQAYERAQTGTKEAREKLGVAIVEAGRLLQNAQEKAQYDRVSYDAEDVQALAARQSQIEAQFVRLQQRFDQAEHELDRREQPTIEQYDTTTQTYQQIQQEVADVHRQLEELAAQRAELDKLAEQATEELENAKKALADVAEKVTSLQSDMPNTSAVTAPVQARVQQAEQASAENSARRSLRESQAASEMAQAILALLATFGSIRAGIVQARNDAERLTAEGYRLEASHAALDTAQTGLRRAAEELQKLEGGEGGSTEALTSRTQEMLEQAQAALDEAIANGRDLPKLRAENERRLNELDALGKDLAHAIVEGRKTFAIVNEFAQSTWDDIRGNGSEAEAVADRARQHWSAARRRNTMEAQEFQAASEDLDAAAEELAYARELVDAITRRLEDLQQARDTARTELADAASDIESGWRFIRENDDDIGKEPEHKLHEAAELLDVARAEMDKDKPDWLLLVEKAQHANRLADEALAGARSEYEAMDKLRTHAQRAQQVAAAEVQKVVKFADLHKEDMQPQSQQQVQQLQQQAQQAAAALQRAHESEEDERRAALQESLDSYTSINQEAGRVYQAVRADFQRFEQLRTELNQELANARQAIASAERELEQYNISRHSQEGQALQRIRQRFDRIKLPIRGEKNLRSTLNMARSFKQEVSEVRNTMHTNHRTMHQHHHHHDSGVGDVVAGMALGMLIDAATRGGGGWGGSGSWSGGDSGDSGGWGDWGGSGGGGGIDWGGGGGGGIDWGGGGGGGIDW